MKKTLIFSILSICLVFSSLESQKASKKSSKKSESTKTDDKKSSSSGNSSTGTGTSNSSNSNSSGSSSSNSTTTTNPPTKKMGEDDKKSKGGLGGLVDGLKKELTKDDANLGVKEALKLGIERGVAVASKEDGFLKNDLIKILLPKEAQVVESTLRKVGMGSKVDEAIKAMNRGAEDASKSALNIFVNSITSMSVSDAIGLIKGGDNSCTEFLRNKSTNELTTAFKPIIGKSLEKTQATKYWSEMFTAYNRIPLVKKVNPDLNQYVTERAIEGLFKMLAQEESKIRKDPAARTSDLLKKIFE
jgi:hypothetical protein